MNIRISGPLAVAAFAVACCQQSAGAAGGSGPTESVPYSFCAQSGSTDGATPYYGSLTRRRLAASEDRVGA
jgi:hypothetical protein